MQSERKAVSDRRLFLRLMIAQGVALLLLLAAMTGMTYVVVELSKDTKQDNNVLVSKDSGAPLATAAVKTEMALADLYLADPAAAQHFEKMTVGNPSGGFDVYFVASLSFQPNVSVTITTTTGKAFLIDSDGVHDIDASAPNGRRLLAPCQATDFNCYIGTVIGTDFNSRLKSIQTANTSRYRNGESSTTNSFNGTLVGATGAFQLTLAAGNSLAEKLSSCSTYSTLTANNSCCDPYTKLNAMITGLDAAYSVNKKGISEIISQLYLPGFSSFQKTLGRTLDDASKQLNGTTTTAASATGGKPITDLFNSIMSSATFETSKCSDCCKNLRDAPARINTLLAKLMALEKSVADKTISAALCAEMLGLTF
jgi:hypothetical protein